MHEVRRRAALGALLDDLGDRAREHGKAHRVVGIILAALAVDAGTVEEPRRVEQHEVDLGREVAVEDGDLVGLAPEIEHERREASGEEQASLLERRKTRHHDGDLVAEGLQRLGERGAHVGEAAHLHEGRELGGNEQDLHRRG